MGKASNEEQASVSALVGELAAATPPEGLEMDELFERIGREGLLIAVMILTAPFLLPVSIPGMSTPFGTLIILICLSLVTGGPLRLPRRLGRLRVKQKHMRTIADKAGALLRRLEAWAKPRWGALTGTRTLRAAHAVGIVAGSVGMMLPLPMPLSNAIPAYAIVFFALGLLRRDGVLVLAGYGMLAATFLYLAVVYAAAFAGLRALLGG
ncbi:exopolysaccharide biosynthesis protein [Paenibacillus antri]|uniref:Exopolysaccharide biosynthesis protein n=1 Tax=Paenibacillus antri TaxID=2582848 RepID=A0A5R9GAH0_9BACL|nr:exopolysaccharide biosynthesis protein [Paenibacillus antri]TLS49723.1 exopolysaccharide biosynthesis protein [Paenibacillus antri]